MIQIINLLLAMLLSIVGFGGGVPSQDDHLDVLVETTDQTAVEIDVETQPYSELESTFDHKGLQCSKVELDADTLQYDELPFMSYACSDASYEQVGASKAAALRFVSGSIVELEYSILIGTDEQVVGTEWGESFLTPGKPVRINDRFWFTETFSNGAHCCFTAHIIDIAEEKSTDAISAGSGPFFTQDEDGRTLLVTADSAFEYFWGAYADHVAPTLYYNINSEGEVGLYNDKMGADSVSEDIISLENMINDLPESEIVSDRSSICEEFYTVEGEERCMFAKREARIIAAATAVYLLADMEGEAEKYFRSKFEWNENTEKRFKEIEDNIR